LKEELFLRIFMKIKAEAPINLAEVKIPARKRKSIVDENVIREIELDEDIRNITKEKMQSLESLLDDIDSGSESNFTSTASLPSVSKAVNIEQMPAVFQPYFTKIEEKIKSYCEGLHTNYYNESGATIKVSAPTAVQKAAVAQLMKYIGFTCYSTYGKSSTGTYPSDSRKYCTNFYFHADSKYTTTKTDFDTNEAFEKAIYNELINRRPIFFCGYKSVYNSKTQKYSANGGHAFNCDGYNASTDKYHFNWGWNGKYNGWFSITALNPEGKYACAGRFPRELMTISINA
jgi:hypothetical protein